MGTLSCVTIGDLRQQVFQEFFRQEVFQVVELAFGDMVLQDDALSCETVFTGSVDTHVIIVLRRPEQFVIDALVSPWFQRFRGLLNGTSRVPAIPPGYDRRIQGYEDAGRASLRDTDAE